MIVKFAIYAGKHDDHPVVIVPDVSCTLTNTATGKVITFKTTDRAYIRVDVEHSVVYTWRAEKQGLIAEKDIKPITNDQLFYFEDFDVSRGSILLNTRLASFPLSFEEVTVRDAKTGSILAIAITDGAGIKLIEKLPAGDVIIQSSRFPKLKVSATVKAKDTIPITLDYLSEAIVNVPVLVVESDNITPIPNIPVSWCHYLTKVPEHSAITGSDGKATIKNCLPGPLVSEAIIAEDNGDFTVAVEIKDNMPIVKIRTKRGAKTGNIRVTCRVKAWAA